MRFPRQRGAGYERLGKGTLSRKFSAKLSSAIFFRKRNVRRAVHRSAIARHIFLARQSR